MSANLTVAITADLHWGHRKGQQATLRLAEHLRAQPPDVFVLAGDVGTGVLFEDCLRLFADLPSKKVVVPGNHDLWVSDEAVGYDSLALFERLLPEAAARQGFVYLDRESLVLPEAGLAIVGSINWYDYSWSLDKLRQLYPQEEPRLKTKRFSRGKHNDGNFVRWPIDDVTFTARVTAGLGARLAEAAVGDARLLVVTHHPPLRGLGFPREDAIASDLDTLLWDAFCGNLTAEQLLGRHAERIAYTFCGHTHRAREAEWQGIRGHNVGGDYHFKRLLWLDWPAGTIAAREFQGE